MTTLEKKIIDFKVKFTRGGWLDEEKNFVEVEKWLKDNLSTEEEIKPVEEIVVEKVVELPIEDLNAPMDNIEPQKESLDEDIDTNDSLMIDEEVKVEFTDEVLEPTPVVKKEGFFDKILG